MSGEIKDHRGKVMPPLPDGWAVRQNDMIGVDFLDQNGDFVTQHPFDCAAIRHMVWDFHRKRESEAK